MLSVKDLQKHYRSKKGEDFHALKGLTIDFPTKGFVFIIGKSGSGKSTLLNVLGGLDRYDSGEIFIKGKSSKTFKAKDWDSYRNTYLGFVFQEFNIIESYTIGANIALALQLQGVKASEAKARTLEILESVEARELVDRKPNELSGGQKQRIAIARALVKNPEIIIADEPTGNLDSETSAIIMKILKRLAEERLVIMVSHDLDYANDYGDRIIEMRDGSIVKDYLVNKKALSKSKAAKTSVPVELDYTIKGSFHLIKSKLPFHNSFSMALNSVWSKKFKLIFVVALFVAAIGLFGFSRTVTRFDFPMAASLSYSQSNTEQVMLTKKIEVLQPWGETDTVSTIFLKSETNNLESKTNLTFGYLYDFSKAVVVGSGKSTTLVRGEELRGALEIDSLRSMDLSLTIGRFPLTNDEVMITDYVAEQLKTTSIQAYLDSNPTLVLPFKTVKVVGIIETDYLDYLFLNGLNESELLAVQGSVLSFKNSDAILYSRIVVGPGFYAAYADNVDVMTNYYYLNVYIASLDNSNEFPYSYIGESFVDPTHGIMQSEYVSFFSGYDQIPENGILMDYNAYASLLVSLGRVSNESSLSYLRERGTLSSKISRLESTGLGALPFNSSFNNRVNDSWDELSERVVVGLIDYYEYSQEVIFPKLAIEALIENDVDFIEQSLFERYAFAEYNKYLETLAAIYFPSAQSFERFMATGTREDFEYYEYLRTGLFDSNVSFISDNRFFGYGLYLRDLMVDNNLNDLTYEQYIQTNDAREFEYIFALQTILTTNDITFLNDENFSRQYLNFGQNYSQYVGLLFRNNQLSLDSIYADLFGITVLSTSLYNQVNPYTAEKVHALVAQLSDDIDENYTFFTDAQLLGVTHATPSGELLEIFEDFTSGSDVLFGYVSLGVAGFAGLLLFLNVSASILAKKKEIGTLRAMGARGNDVASIFVNEALLLGSISAALAIIGIGIATLELNNVLSEQLGQSLAIFNISPIIMIEMMLLTMSIVLIASFLPVKRVSMMKPIDAIKNK